MLQRLSLVTNQQRNTGIDWPLRCSFETYDDAECRIINDDEVIATMLFDPIDIVAVEKHERNKKTKHRRRKELEDEQSESEDAEVVEEEVEKEPEESEEKDEYQQHSDRVQKRIVT